MDLRRSALAVSLGLLLGCINVERQQPRPDTSDTSDTTSPEETALGPVELVHFTSNFRTVTRGSDFRGQLIEGAARLSWGTRGATEVELLLDGVKVALDTCETGSCVPQGSLLVRPTKTSTFTLRALGDCEGPCPEASISIEVRQPVGLTLKPRATTVQPGADAEVDYEFSNYEGFTIGLVDAMSSELRPCVAESDALAAEPVCVATASAGQVSPQGVARVANCDRRQVFSVTAQNGADDGLGDITPEDIQVEVGVSVITERFEVVPAQARRGDEVELHWAVAGAQDASVTTPSEALSGIEACTGLGAGGAGRCTLQLDAEAPLEAIDFVLRSEQVGGAIGESTARLQVIDRPEVSAFTVTPPVAVPGQLVTLAWTAYGTESVVIEADPDDLKGLGACTEVARSGHGSCEVEVGQTDVSEILLTLLAEYGEETPTAKSAALKLIAPPAILAFDVDDATVEPGATITLSWEIANAHEVVLMESSGVVSSAALARCAALSAGDEGGCEIVLPAGLAPGELVFELEAIGTTGAHSPIASLVLTLGHRPEVVAFQATPNLLPQVGGAVTLSWEAPGATQAWIRSDELLRMTAGVTLCGEDVCAAAGDAVVVHTDEATEFLLIAENDFGRSTATRTVRIEGAPEIEELQVDGRDATLGPLEVGPTMTVAWTVDGVSGDDLVRLDRAPSPGPDRGCADVAVASWTPVLGFPKYAQEAAFGSAQVDGLDQAATCLRFIAVDVDTTPNQRDVAVFQVYRRPELLTLNVADATLQPGDHATLSWTTARAYRVELTVSPEGAVTSDALRDCSSANGSCRVQLQPNAALGEVTFSLVAVGEKDSRSAARTASLTLGNAPKIDSFAASPDSIRTTSQVSLAWTTTRADSVTIREVKGGEVFTSAEPGVVQNGARTIPDVASTTTWELEAVNAFGATHHQVTTYVGPSIDLLRANGGDAKDGLEVVPTGQVTVTWTTTSADGSHHLETTAVPGNGSCVGAGGWTTAYLNNNPAPNGAHTLGVVTSNRCVRLTVTNSQTPPQTSAVTFLLRETPMIDAFTTSPGAVNVPGNVTIKMDLRGTTSLKVTAQYLNNGGNVVGSQDVCTQSNLNSGTLTGGANSEHVECTHSLCKAGLLSCWIDSVPAAATWVRYALEVSDAEGDRVTTTTSRDAGDVRLND